MNAMFCETETIKAARIHSFGGPETVCVEDVTPPTSPMPQEVLVRVRAAGVNPCDWKTREGLFGPLPMPRTLGCDFSGIVESLGPGVTDFFVGQPVFGHSGYGGAFAELVVAPASGLAAKLPGLDDIDAAATPLCALTAWQALFEVAGLKSAQRVLIHGGAGGVGLFAVQLALRQGAWVIATSSTPNIPFLRQLGAHQVIDYTTTRFEDAIGRVDIVLDLIGGETQERSWNLVKTGGWLVSTVSTPSPDQAFRRGIHARKITTKTRADDLILMGDLIANGEIKVVVDKVLPLSAASEALEISRRGHGRGKMVLTVDHDDSVL